jgi:NAD(P)H-quinone oxidoreductase subunit 4
MLSALIWLPLLGAIAIGFWPRGIKPQSYRFLALAVAIVVLIWTGVIVSQFDITQSDIQFSEKIAFDFFKQPADGNCHLD